MDSIQKLTKIFAEFPGIGPKQARRFVYFLLRKNPGYVVELKNQIDAIKKEIRKCKDCGRYFPIDSSKKDLCVICADESRDVSFLMIVGKDIDLENIEKSHSFLGKYFVLGGLVPILDKNPEEKIQLKELTLKIESLVSSGLKEIILGLDVNSEGEYTAGLIKQAILSICENNKIKISELGRGLSTGAELEYSDPDTIKGALKNRE